MTYELIGKPRVESEYCDDYETTMVIDLQREDGETGDVWIVAGVPDYQRGTARASGSQQGLCSVRVFGDSVDMWCPESFRVEDALDEDDLYTPRNQYTSVMADVLAAVESVALQTHTHRTDCA